MKNLIKVENNIAYLDDCFNDYIKNSEKQIAEIKEKLEEFKSALLKEMEERGVTKIESPDLIITYIAPTDRETFDSKTFKTEHKDLYDEYVKITPVKSSVKIKVKE